ncbi:unnamed protein product [Penicillium salamii]|uniref:Uncharacterized protein n=1 Tax=Penicillium salamii TaxID=1612424 RepID=A0A9W4NPU0_9EURO|nr:unnamed protein product [Penicillium salamii]CAG8047197.1 unnamed protein product [Penicillium salamii]CAG8147153.1 unnamed protein product [Penicillium salamii]CAG8210595.1 unnamed protein product [Penicillium salamii]CAG8317508.1 unnamed protein product [Penicillium salamii]
MRYPVLTRPFGRQLPFRQSSTNLSCSFFASLRKSVLFQPPLSRSFTSGSIKTQAMLDAMSPATRLLDEYLREGGYQKWGWVVYRSTYQNDEDWNCFKGVIMEAMRKSIEHHKTPDLDHSLNQSLSLTFLEDRPSFENASKDQLRAHFQGWAQHAYYAENPRPFEVFDPNLATAPRYRYFIQIDENSLQSLLHDIESGSRLKGLQDYGYVNFVDGWWKSLREYYATSQDPDIKEEMDEQLARDYRSIEGCVEENTGWTMLHRLDMSVDFYHYTSGFVEDVWPLYYQRPPGIALW